MSRPQEVSLARLLHVYETRAASGGRVVGGAGNRTRPPQRREDGDRSNGSPSTSDPDPTTGAVDGGGGGGGGGGGPGGGDGDGDGDGAGDGWRRGPKAHQHLEAMRRLLAEVRAHDASAADAYGKRVDRVEAMLEPYKKPAFCMGTSSSQVEWQPYKPPAPRQRRGVAGGGGGGLKGRGTSVKISEDGHAAMARQRDLQEGLTDEMVELASSIKANSVAMEASLKESRRELDAAEGNLERNLGGVKTAVGRQLTVYKLNASG